MNQNYNFKKLNLGVCYYPEHWSKNLWQEDLQRMKKSGITTIRIAEFAWNKIEVKENHFDFSFFDEFLDLCEKENISVIFGTPTATPPAWLSEKYPEILNCRIDGAKYNHGMRRHYNYNSKKYQYFCKRIVTKIMQHYGKRKCIIGYQIDNEINCEVADFFSPSDDKAFRKFLKEKYKTLDSLNEHWGTVFWNQTYTSWKEVHLPRLTVQNSPNPHQKLDYFRFVSQSAINFCKMQSQIIRKYKNVNTFITTNGMFSNLDNHKIMNECLDVFTYDSYPNFAFCLNQNPKTSKDLNDRMWSKNLSETRSVCRNFGIMEQQSGANGWNTRMEAISPKPGQISLWATQSLAHGADFISFFRWRTCTFGTEMYWHGILDYDNLDNRKLDEISKFSERIKKLQNLIGTNYKAKVALLRDYDNIFDSQFDVWHSRCSEKSEKEIFIACQINHTPLDYVYINDDFTSEDLNNYKLIFYPHPEITTEKIVQKLSDFVESGGILILGARSGQKSFDGKVCMTQMPGLFSKITKTSVQDFTFVADFEEKSTMLWNGISLETGIFNDILTCSAENSSSKILARYNTNYYDTKPALIETSFGLGKVLHFGGTFTRENVKAFLKYTNQIEPLSEKISVPECVELACRSGLNGDFIFVLNFAPQNCEIELKSEALDLDTNQKVQGKIMLNAYETKILKTYDD